VNVHKLKDDVWSRIEHSLGDHDDHQTPSKSHTQSNNTLSFQKLVKNLSVGPEKQPQKDASLSYYFICLLHLANEHQLVIEGQQDLSDLKILY
jgi:condensin complex subunit 2